MLILSPGESIALGSAIISVSALGISFWNGYLTRRHYILSVKPCLDFFVNTYKKEPFSISIQNNGLGPAFLKSITAKMNGKTYHLNSELNIQMLITDIAGLGTNHVPCYHVHDKGSVLPAASNTPLLEIIPEGPQDLLRNNINTAIKTLTLKVEYSCMYGNQHECDYSESSFQA